MTGARETPGDTKLEARLAKALAPYVRQCLEAERPELRVLLPGCDRTRVLVIDLREWPERVLTRIVSRDFLELD